MKARPQTVRTIDLGYEQLFVFDGGPDTRVRVMYGGTWLTEEGIGEDSILRAGEEVALHGVGRALIEGLSPARVQIVESPPPGALAWSARSLRQAGRGLRRMVERLRLGERPAVEPNA